MATNPGLEGETPLGYAWAAATVASIAFASTRLRNGRLDIERRRGRIAGNRAASN